MDNHSHRSSTTLVRIRVAAGAIAVVGAVLFLAATVLEWSGFWGGVAQGAAIALIVGAAYLGGLVTGLRRGGPSATWLPAGPDA